MRLRQVPAFVGMIALTALLCAMAIVALTSRPKMALSETDPCSSLDVADNKWHTAIFTFVKGTGTIWCDGIELASRSGFSSPGNTPTELLIGADFNGWRDRVWGRFVGVIDEVRISKAPRTPTDGALVADEETIALWHFDESDGDSVLDSSGHGLNGHIYRCRRTGAGLRGGAIEFTGEGYVVVPNSPLLSPDTLCIELSFRTAATKTQGYESPVLIAKYVNDLQALSEYCVTIGGKTGRGLSLTRWGEIVCSCPSFYE